jgi:hypothetical protein
MARIVKLIASDGEVFSTEDGKMEIKPFSQASFVIRYSIDYGRRFLILPTRAVDRIWMEDEVDGEAGNKIES